MMKRLKTKPIWKASNVWLDTSQMIAKSYDWWIFVKSFNGRIVFNNYNYSNSTIKHQAKVSKVLDFLNLKISHYIEAPNGLQDLTGAISYYNRLIEGLKAEMNRPRTHKKKNIEREAQIEYYRTKITEVELLQKGV